ncbi:hypothetical protein ACQP2F_46015 [Actinoplanes sp. CA-030573]|uniref:hypothetical protein n=1 Tax=Actinoplanes sp. CA-030573 TaxID=3239898 RepID=UPI003D8E9864
MSPRTHLIPLSVLSGALVVALAACGEPPQALPKSPPLPSPSAAPLSLPASPPGGPALGVPTAGATQTLPTLGITPTLPAYPNGYPNNVPGYPVHPTTTPTHGTGPATVSPTPTPSHAAKCTGSPTAAQIITLLKGDKGMPDKPLRVADGPFCQSDWSFATLEVVGESEDQTEPLMVVATGKDATLKKVAAGSEVCLNKVVANAPAGIRVLACGS